MTSAEEYEAIEVAFSGSETLDRTAQLTESQRARLREYWVDRADGELTTALSFEYMLDDLRAEGAPAPVLELAESAIADEHRHVDWCLRWARHVGPGEPALARFHGTRPLRFDGASDHDNRLLRSVFGSCFSETVAVHVLTASHAAITLESVRALNHRHLKEEIRHARLGWALLAWDGLTERDRTMIAAHVPAMLEITRKAWLSTPRPADEELHALGFLSSPMVRAACNDALESVVLPGLVHHRVLPGQTGK
jgi:hypothetical protein